MARLPGISPVGVPVHVIQRGNNRQACFVSAEDHGAYVGWLKEYSKKYGWVTDPGEYRWSSYQVNALGKVSDL